MTALMPAGSRAAGPTAGTGLVLEGATRWFAGRRVLGPVCMELGRGAVCLVYGANGAGKTTLLRVAAGLLAPSAGRWWCGGLALYLRSGAGLRDVQLVGRAVGWVARLRRGHGLPVAEALALAGAADLADVRAAALSAGQRARVSLALALVAGPALVCLDEPAAHLDGEGRVGLGRVVAALAGSGAGVLLATHHRDDSDDLAGLADARVWLREGVPEAVS